jgi:glycosyltransferase involved in cell wall biosynthesis
MKILFLFPHFLSPGGAATVVLQFARGLQQKGHKVEIICARVSEEFQQSNPDIKFRELKIPLSNSLFYWMFLPFWQLRINRMLRSYKEYILFPQVLPSNWWAWLYKRKQKAAPIVWYCHDAGAFIHSSAWINAIPNKTMRWGAKLLNPLLKKADKALEKANDVVICNSNFIKAAYEKIYKGEVDLVVHPPCTVLNTELEKQKDNYIITACRISKFKKVDMLIKAFKIISNDLNSCKLLIVGDGEERRHLERLSNNLRLSDHVSFLGNKTPRELFSLYQKAKVTVICSRDEPFGLVPIESMLCGTPVIAHNSGGPKETILNGITGFLYDDETELVKLIKKMFEMDDEQYFQMQRKCVSEGIKYDISKSVSEIEFVLRRLSNFEYGFISE